MARKPKRAQNAALSLIELPSTSVDVHFNGGMTYATEQGVPDQDFMTYQIALSFNGFIGETTNSVTFPRLSSQAQRQAAVRDKVNAIMNDPYEPISEPGNSFTNAQVQIRGMPV